MKKLQSDEKIMYTAQIKKFNRWPARNQNQIFCVTKYSLLRIFGNEIKQRIMVSDLQGLSKSEDSANEQFIVHQFGSVNQ